MKALKSLTLQPKIEFRIFSLAAWFLFIFFAGAGIFALISHQFVLVPGIFAVSGYGFFVLFYFGNVEFNERGIKQSTLSGKYEILWDEVKQIELTTSAKIMVFVGEQKALTIIGPGHFRDEEISEIVSFVDTQAKLRKIPTIENAKGFRFPKNTKITS